MDTQFQDHDSTDGSLLALALQIAEQQRGKAELQPIEDILVKIGREFKEFDEALNDPNKTREDACSELADLEYYQDQIEAWIARCRAQIGVTEAQSRKIARVKYVQRIQNNREGKPKFYNENAAIRAALEEE